MMAKWDANKIRRQLVEYSSDPFNSNIFLDKNLNLLSSAVATGSPRIGLQLAELANWYGNLGVVSLFDSPPKGLAYLHQSVYYTAADMVRARARYTALPDIMPITDSADAALTVARAITLACFEDAHTIFNAISAAPVGILGGLEFGKICPFVFNIYAQWANVVLHPELVALKVLDPYIAVLTYWRSNDIKALGAALITACDFHMARSRTNNSREYFEFCNSSFRLQPVEILAVLRMREELGLENPVLDHPVMNSPAGKLYPPIQVEPDPIIAAALKVTISQWEAKGKEGRKIEGKREER